MSTRNRLQYLCVLLVVSLAGSGCTRQFFRNWTDRDAMALIHQKDDPRWKPDQFHIYPDPRARFADWTNPDRPPMPPDDLAARILSPNPQKPYHKAGIDYIEGTGYLELLAQWDAQNRAEEEKRKPPSPLPTDDPKNPKKEGAKMIGAAGPTVPVIDVVSRPELQNEFTEPTSQTSLLPPSKTPPPEKKKPFMLSLEQAVELATINSREFQTERETLYLAALPVSIERFAFATQFYATETIFRQKIGGGLPDGPTNGWAFNTVGGVSKLFSTGALLLAQFANNTVVNLGSLAGAPRTISQSNISLDLVQPLLRGGGRAVTLEPLTQSERNLLYAVRDYARYRQQFYAYIAVGQAAFIPGIQAGVPALTSGTVQTPTPFTPFATPLAQGVGGPNIQVAVPPAAGGKFGPIAPAGANPQGYLNTMVQKAQLISYVKNVHSLDYFFKLLKVYQEGGIVNPVQVGQVEQKLLGGIETMLQNWVQYRQALDLFRIQLGLPTSMPLELDDTPLEPMYALIRRYEENSTYYAEAVNLSQTFDQLDDAEKLRGRLRKLLTASPLVKGLAFEKEIQPRWQAWEKLTKTAEVNARLRDLRGELRKLLDRKADLELKAQTLPEADTKRIEQLNFEIDLGEFELILRNYETQPWKGLAEPKARRDRQSSLFGQVHRSFVPLLSEAVRQRLEYIRGSWPALPPAYICELNLLSADEDTALESITKAALENRLDLMNQKAQLVDSWRKLRVAANALMGTFNVEYHMDSSTPPDAAMPFAFRSGLTRHQLIFNAQLPLVRIIERNNYRSTLITYQQQRRAWMDAMDQIVFAVRFDLRNLRVTAYNYHRVQRRAMELAYLQVDQALQAFSQPVAPSGPAAIGIGPPTAGGSQGDPAALTQQLLNVQSSLVSAQIDLYTQWLGYLQNRIYLYRDLGLMPLDSRGVWIDDVANYRRCDPSDACLPSYPGSGSGNSGERRDGSGEELPEPRLLPPTFGTPR